MRAKGIDISHWQGSFTDPGNLDFIIVKASDGILMHPWYTDHWDEIAKVPIRGAYHYFRTERPPTEQALTLLNAISSHKWHFIAVDYETRGNTLDRQGALNLLAMLKYLRNIQDLPVLLYTGAYLYRDNLRVWSEEFDEFLLWLARWRYSDKEVADPTGSLSGDDLDRSWTFWQWTNLGKGDQAGVESETVDRNVYNGTYEDLCVWLIPVEEEETDMKKWYQSKTLWFSIVFIITAVAGLFGYGDWTPDTQLVEYVQLGMGVLMALLRVFTNQGVEL